MKFLLIVFYAFIGINLVFGQHITVSGFINDDATGECLIGANVINQLNK